MGKLEVISIDGVELYVPSNDHYPPHFHVHKNGDWLIRVFFLDCTEGHLAFEQVWSKKSNVPPRGVKRELLRKIVANREAVLAEWTQKVCLD